MRALVLVILSFLFFKWWGAVDGLADNVSGCLDVPVLGRVVQKSELLHVFIPSNSLNPTSNAELFAACPDLILCSGLAPVLGGTLPRFYESTC